MPVVSQAEHIANKPSVEISKEVITTGQAPFLTVHTWVPPYRRIDLNEEAMTILGSQNRPHSFNLDHFNHHHLLVSCVETGKMSLLIARLQPIVTMSAITSLL